VRVAAEVDPHLEITEIVDRTVKAGGPALLFEHPKGSEHPLLINQFGTERRMCLAFGVERLDDVGQKLGDVLEMQPPQGLVEKVKGLQKLKSIADSRPKSVAAVPARRSCSRATRSTSTCCRSRPAGRATRRRSSPLPAVITKDPEHRPRERRHVPDAEDRQALDLHALADPQGRRMDYLATGRRLDGRGRDRASTR
jgi:hypothetical protein